MIKGRLLLDLEETNALAQFTGVQELLQGKVETPEQLMQEYSMVTAEQIKQLARELFVNKKRAVAVLGSSKSVERVRQEAAKSLDKAKE